MTLDYDSHPAELVEGGIVRGKDKDISISDLRKAIPPHCFKIDYTTALSLLTRDLILVFFLGWTAWTYIPLIRYKESLEFDLLRYSAWIFYGYAQGLVFTGLWVLGHEASHGNISPVPAINDLIGFLCDSALLTPYFSFKSTHRRHHIYANNLAKDHQWVPFKREEYANLVDIDPDTVEETEDALEDAPIAALIRGIRQQLLGWPMYLASNITASKGASHRAKSGSYLANGHFLPSSTLFRPEEAHLVVISNIGLAITIGALLMLGKNIGFSSVALLYGQSYLWVNHWIVAITFLHHTDPKVPRYDPEAWTFLKGALATMDRNLGWVGKHILHNIADFHVIHHLFPRIPQYHAEEATKAVMPLLGEAYRSDKDRSFATGYWESLRKCQWVKPDNAVNEKDRAYWFRTGASPSSIGRWWARSI